MDPVDGWVDRHTFSRQGTSVMSRLSGLQLPGQPGAQRQQTMSECGAESDQGGHRERQHSMVGLVLAVEDPVVGEHHEPVQRPRCGS